MRSIFYLLLLFFFLRITGAESEISASLGGGYNSNIRYLTTKERASGNKKELQSPVITANLLGELSFMEEKGAAEISFSGEAPTSYPEHSIINNAALFSYLFDVSEHLKVSPLLYLHQSLKKSDSPEAIYHSSGAGTLFLYEKDNNSSFFLEFQQHYYFGNSENYKAFAGPAGSIEIGTYYYPENLSSSLSASFLTEYTSFRNERFTFDNQEDIVISNRAVKISPRIKLKYLFENIETSLIGEYAYIQYLDYDGYETNKEKRKDHFFHISPAISYLVSQNLSIKLAYSFYKNNSSISGRKSYTDYSYEEQCAASSITYIY